MYEVMEEKRFEIGASIPMPEYEAMRQEVRNMSFVERLELARNSEIGRKLFPLECEAQFCIVSKVKILCLTNYQLQALLLEHSHLKDQYSGIRAIENDPVPTLGL
jgi:hypothetical protein